jgi:uncharacterized protein (DUF4415 family)
MFGIFPQHYLQAGLKNRHHAIAQAVYARLIDIHAHDVVADFRQTGPAYQSYVTAADD